MFIPTHFFNNYTSTACFSGILTSRTMSCFGGTKTLQEWLRRRPNVSNMKPSCRQKPLLMRKISWRIWYFSEFRNQHHTLICQHSVSRIEDMTCWPAPWPRDKALDEAEGDAAFDGKPGVIGKVPASDKPRPEKRPKTPEQEATQATVFWMIWLFNYCFIVLHRKPFWKK